MRKKKHECSLEGFGLDSASGPSSAAVLLWATRRCPKNNLSIGATVKPQILTFTASAGDVQNRIHVILQTTRFYIL